MPTLPLVELSSQTSAGLIAAPFLYICRLDAGLGRPAAQCITVSLFVELLRTRPRLLFWTMALPQAVLWTLVPALFYSAPPGELAAGAGDRSRIPGSAPSSARRWRSGLPRSPIALAGMFGVYLLSQLCIVATFWAVFALGRAIVGDAHAVLAVLLMVGIAVFSVPTPEFGPAILAMPLWALMLLHYWRAAAQGRAAPLGRARRRWRACCCSPPMPG